MARAAQVVVGATVLILITFAHPFEGNTYGFCPIFKSPLHTANDVVVAALDVASVWLIYRVGSYSKRGLIPNGLDRLRFTLYVLPYSKSKT